MCRARKISLPDRLQLASERGFIEGNSSTKQPAVHRKVIAPLTLAAHVRLRRRLLSLPHPHREDLLDKQPAASLGDQAVKANLCFSPFF